MSDALGIASRSNSSRFGSRAAVNWVMPVALLPGRYRVRAHALDPEGVRLFDHVEQTITVTGATRELGFVRLPHRWQTPL